MNTEAVLSEIPAGNLWLTLRDLAGNEMVSAVPIGPPTAVDPSNEVLAGDAGVWLGWDDGSDQMYMWRVTEVASEGPRVILTGPDGSAVLTRRPAEDDSTDTE